MKHHVKADVRAAAAGLVNLDRDGIGAGRQRVGHKGASAPTIINGSDFIRGNGPAPNCEIIHDTGQMTSSTAVVDTEIGGTPQSSNSAPEFTPS